MGYVPANQANVGTALTVNIRGTPTEAMVVAMPFYKRK